jgi:hypothetical protein
MGFWDKLLGNGIGVAAEGVGSLALDIREAIKGKEVDPMKQLELIAKAAETQAKVNEVEAGHRSLFVSGWRPFIGWVCGMALAYHFMARDLMIFIWPHLAELPSLEMDQLMTVLMGMLGLGGLRTYEKFKGVSK